MPHEPGHVPPQLEGFPVPPPIIGGGPQRSVNYIGYPSGFEPDLSALSSVPGRQPFSPVQSDRPAFQSRPRSPLYLEGQERDPASLSGEDISELQDKMVRAGLLEPKKFKRGVWFGTTINAYAQVLGYANSRGLPAEAALDELVEVGGLAEEVPEGPFTGTKKRTQKSVNLTDPQSARVALRRTLREELGRAPTPEEISAFVAALNAAEQQNPSVSNVTETWFDGDITATSTSTSGGLNPEAFMDEFVENDPALEAEADAFTRDTEYYDAVMRVLGEGGGAL